MKIHCDGVRQPASWGLSQKRVVVLQSGQISAPVSSIDIGVSNPISRDITMRRNWSRESKGAGRISSTENICGRADAKLDQQFRN